MPSRYVVPTLFFSAASTVVVVGCLAGYVLAASLTLIDRLCLSLHALTRAGHRDMRLKGTRLRRSLPLPQTDTPKNPYQGEKIGWPPLLYQPRQRSWLRPPPERLANRTAVLCPRKPSTANMGGNMDFCPSFTLSSSFACAPHTRGAMAPPRGVVLLAEMLDADLVPSYYVSRSFVSCCRIQANNERAGGKCSVQDIS
jgi:hypothetical protein